MAALPRSTLLLDARAGARAASRRLIAKALARISSLSGDIVIFLKCGDQFTGDGPGVARLHSPHSRDQFLELCGGEFAETRPQPCIVEPRNAILAQNPQNGVVGRPWSVG